MECLNVGDLKIDVAVGSDPQKPIRLDWRGKSNARQPHLALEPFFAAVLADAVTAERGVEMHFEALAHFNSSTIGFLIQLIREAKAKAVKLTIVYDATVSWQAVSFDVFRIFAKDNAFFELARSTAAATGASSSKTESRL